MPSDERPKIPDGTGAFLIDEITPDQLDMALSKGWRHFGQLFYFYHESEGENGDPSHHVRPLRVRVGQFRRSKSQRRTWNRNTNLALEVRPLQFSEELDALFEIHKKRFPKDIPASLTNFLGESPELNPTDTRQFEIRLDGKLIACSFLDLGKNTVSSIYAMFDPAESHRRLGIYTMLLELDWAQKNGMDFYYSGYAYLEPSHYDYKKEFTGLEFYDWKLWHPLDVSGTLS